MPLSKEVVVSSAIPAGEGHIGQIGTPGDIIDVTLVLDTNQYGSGDVMSISALLSNVARVNDGKVYPYAIQVVDTDKQAGAFDILFFRANVSVGTINNAHTLAAAGAADLLGYVSVAATDYDTTRFGNFYVATLKDTDTGWKMGLWETVAASKNIYIATISRDTKTYTASGIKLKISVGQN